MVLLRKNSEFYLIWRIIGPVKRSTVLIVAFGTSFVWIFRKDNIRLWIIIKLDSLHKINKRFQLSTGNVLNAHFLVYLNVSVSTNKFYKSIVNNGYLNKVCCKNITHHYIRHTKSQSIITIRSTITKVSIECFLKNLKIVPTSPYFFNTPKAVMKKTKLYCN